MDTEVKLTASQIRKMQHALGIKEANMKPTGTTTIQFTDPNDITSIKLIDARSYKLIRE